MSEIYYESSDCLMHHGVKGQKWGVRKFKNEDGTLNDAGLARQRKKRINMTVTAGAIGVAYFLKKHPEVVGNAVAKVKGVKSKVVSKETVDKGKHYAGAALKNIGNGVKEGVKESTIEAPKKVTKVILGGAALYGAKKLLDKSIGKTDSDIIFRANNNKNIDKFWKVDDKKDSKKSDDSDDTDEE